MRLSRSKTSLLSLAVLAALSSPALAQVKVDGVVDPAEWQGARHVTDFRMVQPFTQGAVSYTHLDVYKRQGPENPTGDPTSHSSRGTSPPRSP